MEKRQIVSGYVSVVLFILIFGLAAALAIAHEAGPLRGTVIDLVCYLNEGEASFRSDHRPCAEKCLKMGLPAAILDKKTGKITLLVGEKQSSVQEKVLPFLYQNVTVKGKSLERGGMDVFEIEEIEKIAQEAPKAEHVHNHTTFHGGQVGMSGDFHIEFVAKKEEEYRLYVTDFLRKPVDITNAAGTLVINTDGTEPEKLILTVDAVLQEFLVAKGKPRPANDTIVASARIAIPGKEPIFIEFAEQIGASRNGKGGQEGHRH